MNLGESKEEELDASELMNLLDFDEEMWMIAIVMRQCFI